MLSGPYVRLNRCLRHHLQPLPIVCFQTMNGVFEFPIAGDLFGYDFNFCPEMVMHDVIRTWNEVNGVLPGISLTTPIFSDGYIDVNPSVIGPRFSLFEEYIPLTRPIDDWYNCYYSSFIYIPEKFREFDREIQPVLSTEVDCLSHYYQQQSDKTGEANNTEFLRAHCIPIPDRYKTLKNSNDLFAKVLCTNAAMRNSLKACNTLQCFTLFKNSYVSNNPIDYDGNLSILKMICNEEITNWKDLYSSNVLSGLKEFAF